jgi:uncharacterized protein YjbJ (UPF0337 family)
MNEDIIKGRWKQLKGSIKQRWAQLTDDDLTRLEADRDYLLGKLQERYGITCEQAERQLREFESLL